MVKVDRKFLLKLQILFGFVFIYFASSLSLLNIIYAYFNLINGFPHPFYLALGLVLFWLVAILFNRICGDVEELTKLKIKESEVDGKNEGAKD